MQAAVFAAKIQKRIAPRLKPGALYLADEDDVIAAFMDSVARAFERRQRARQNRRAVKPRFPGRRAEPVLIPAGKADRGGLLTDVKDVYRKMRGCPEHF